MKTQCGHEDKTLLCVEVGWKRLPNLWRITRGVLLPSIQPRLVLDYLRTHCPDVLRCGTVSRVYPATHAVIDWPHATFDVVEKPYSSPKLQDLLATAACQQSLRKRTDKQIGQLVYDYVWNELDLSTAAMAVAVEATHRLYRSSGGPSIGEPRLNEPDCLAVCPSCGSDMLRRIGIDEPDYYVCTALGCGNKVTKREGEQW